jgi:hypothetical protein
MTRDDCPGPFAGMWRYVVMIDYRSDTAGN